MSYHTPNGWADRATFVDKRLPHQIRIDINQRTIGSPILLVRCSCSRDAIAQITTADQALSAFREHVSFWESVGTGDAS